MNALTPWAGVTALRKEMDRLLERFWEPDFAEWPTLGQWAPKVDIADTKTALVVKAEIPGIEPAEIGLTLEDQLLTIKGEKKQEKETKDEQYYRMERSYGAFARTIRLPAPVDASRVTATFKHGVLTVTLPKGAVAKGTAIPIKTE
jgi:HSP20 family protein